MELRMKLARTILGPHHTDSDSIITLAMLRECRWTFQSTAAERADALNAADAILREYPEIASRAA